MRKRHYLILVCLGALQSVLGQDITFEQIEPLPTTPQNTADFDGVWSSSIAFSDIDNDGDADVVITGANASNQRISKLYTNDGTGSFMAVTGTLFDGVWYSSIAFSDIDNDGDSDVLITGENASDQRISKLYRNDGTGSFTEVTGAPFDGVRFSSIAFSDIDNDGDADVLIAGENTSIQRISKLYTNDGSGNFTEVTGTPFDGVSQGSIAFSDIDNDGDSDVLITGLNSIGRISKLYTNDGTGNFTAVTGTPFDGVWFSSIAFSDVDNDGDSDVLITGQNASSQMISKLYTNDGTGSFREETGTPFQAIDYSSIAFSDIDNDGDSDLLITGQNASYQYISKMYTNDGGNFTEVMDTPFDGVRSGSIAFSDVDNDGDVDALITGVNSLGHRIAKAYRNTTVLDYVAPSFTSSGSVSVEENSTGVAYTATADEEVTFVLGSSKDENLFTLANDNEISFSSSPDFESPQDGDANNTYVIDVIATDAADNATTLEVTITVTDVDEIAPTFTSANSASFEESATGVAYTATINEVVTFTLENTKDESLFTLANDNEISFTIPPDFENPLDGDANNTYIIDVIATDAAGNETTLEVTITVTDVDEVAPAFTSASSASFTENAPSIAYTATANEDVTFTLGSIKDESLFTLANDNEISFTSLPDFENPQDADANNTYVIDIIATDAAGNETTLEVSITVTDVDEIPPTFTPPSSADFAENSTEVAYTATADEEVTFTLGSDKDESLFTLANENEISFISPPDYENPLDADGDNVYLIDVIATDPAGNSTTLEVSITVTDVDDDPLGIGKTHEAFTIYPNPTNGHFWIDSEYLMNAEYLQILSMDGRMVKRITIKEGANYDVTDVSAGTYLVTINSGQQVLYFGRLLKK